MTTATVPAEPPLASRIRWAVSDALVLSRRNLLVWMRVPAYIFFAIVQPTIFVLMFRFVFGGAIQTGNSGGYVNFLMPGIIGQTAAFASFGTAIALAIELQKGVIDRYRAMPMARSAVLLGRLIADAVRLFITLIVILLVGYAVGFRFQNGLLPAVGMVLLAEAFGLTVCCVSGYVGLAIKDEESVQSFGLIWLFPLTFLSSAFVPIATMPGWLQAFARNQPATTVIDTMRSLALGGPVAAGVWQSIAWLAAISLIFGTLAVRAYRRV